MAPEKKRGFQIFLSIKNKDEHFIKKKAFSKLLTVLLT